MADFTGGRARALLALLAGILVADRATKILAERWLEFGDPAVVIPGLFRFTLVHNTGMAFGLLDGASFAGKAWALTGLSVALLGAVVWFAVRSGPLSRLSAFGIAAMLAGALGNIWDRILHGHVVDFLDLHLGSAHWPTFNLADAAICTGVGLMILDGVRETRQGADRSSGDRRPVAARR